jgi:hypothetical protein
METVKLAQFHFEIHGWVFLMGLLEDHETIIFWGANFQNFFQTKQGILSTLP